MTGSTVRDDLCRPLDAFALQVYNLQPSPCEAYGTEQQRRMYVSCGQLIAQVGGRGGVHTTLLVTGLDKKTKMKGILSLKADSTL